MKKNNALFIILLLSSFSLQNMENKTTNQRLCQNPTFINENTIIYQNGSGLLVETLGKTTDSLYIHTPEIIGNKDIQVTNDTISITEPNGDYVIADTKTCKIISKRSGGDINAFLPRVKASFHIIEHNVPILLLIYSDGSYEKIENGKTAEKKKLFGNHTIRHGSICKNSLSKIVCALTMINNHSEKMDNTIDVYYLPNKQSISKLSHEESVEQIGFNTNASLLATQAKDGVRVWDPYKGSCLQKISSNSLGCAPRLNKYPLSFKWSKESNTVTISIYDWLQHLITILTLDTETGKQRSIKSFSYTHINPEWLAEESKNQQYLLSYNPKTEIAEIINLTNS